MCRSSSFQVVVQCLPLFRTSPFDATTPPPYSLQLYSPPAFSLLELARVLSHHGYLIIGYPESVWDDLDVQYTLHTLTQDKLLDFLSLQRLDLTVEDVELLPHHQTEKHNGFEGKPSNVARPVPSSDGKEKEHEPHAQHIGSGGEVIKYCIAVARKLV